MTAEPASPARGRPGAPDAFLRGLERRALVLAELQCGDGARAEAAVASAGRRFLAGCAHWPLAEWPTRFWAALLAQPALSDRAPVALALDAGDRLGELGAGTRAALLLRLVAGLGDDVAAAALGVTVGRYRRALQAAVPRDPHGAPDPHAWARLQAHVQRRIDAVGGERLARLRAAVPAPAAGRAAPPSRRTLRGLLWVLLALCALALLATFLPPFRDAYLDRVERGEPRVTVAPLPPPEPPRVRLDPDAQLLAHRDFALLASDAPPAPEALAFASWLAAQQDPARPPPAPLVPREGTAEEEARALGLTEDADAPAR